MPKYGMGVPSARGSTWAANAIYGDYKDGTGLLNNKLYIGQYIWNRSEWIKNPDTGRRKKIKRDNTQWVVTDMPNLRIVSQPMWDAVQERQLEIRQKSEKLREVLNNPNTRSRTGKYLFSGLLQCGCCGASYTICSATSYGCAMNINRGDSVCDNRVRVSRRLLEERLLDVVKQDLMTEEAIDLFLQETSRLLNVEKSKPQADLEAHKRHMVQTELQINNLMKAIKAGIITPTTKAELERAEAEHAAAKATLDASNQVENVLTTTLPNAAERYKKLVADLGRTLQTDIGYARQCLKTLLGVVKLAPSPTGNGLEAELRHDPEGLLRLALGTDFKVRMVVYPNHRFELSK